MDYFDSKNLASDNRVTRFEPARNTALVIAFGLTAAALAGAAAVAATAGNTLLSFAAALAAALAASAGGIFFLRHPRILVWLLIFTSPFSDHLSLMAGGLNFRPYVALSVLGVLLIVWQFIARRPVPMREIAIEYKGTIAIVLLLLASKCVTVLTLSVIPPYMTSIFCFKIILFTVLQFAASIVVACFIDTPERLNQVLRGWIHVSNVVCFIAFIQLVLANALGMERYVWHREIISIGRPYSVFREPDVLGCYYAAFIVMLIPLVVAKVQFVSRPYLVLSLLTHTLSLMLIVVRAAWIATVMCVVIYVAMMLMTRRYGRVMPYLNGVLAALLLGGIGLVIAAPTVAERVFERFASVSNPRGEAGSAYRINDMKYQLAMVIHPSDDTGGVMPILLGYGDFSWCYWAPYVIPEDEFDQAAKTRAKGDVLINPGFNMFLSMQFDNGLIGFGLYITFFLALTANFLKTLRRTQDATRQALLLATYLPVVAVLVCFVFSYDPLLLTIWILLGFHLAAAYHVNRLESGVDEIGIPEPA